MGEVITVGKEGSIGMKWLSWSDFFAMGGYGLYVWGSYALVLLWMLAEPFLAAYRHKQLMKTMRETNSGSAS